MILSYLTYFLLALLLHEVGHIAAAWACGITVTEFGIGWGRRLFGIRVKGLEAVVRVLPLGAYVRLDMVELQRRALSKQVLVLLAGIIVNLVAAASTSGNRFSLMNYLLAATNILPLYQQDGWKCGIVMLRGMLNRKSWLAEWTFTIAGSGLSLVIFVSAVFRYF
jgi:membrane-associated protease RseP (regulator of RpoE activity)